MAEAQSFGIGCGDIRKADALRSPEARELIKGADLERLEKQNILVRHLDPVNKTGAGADQRPVARAKRQTGRAVQTSGASLVAFAGGKLKGDGELPSRIVVAPWGTHDTQKGKIIIGNTTCGKCRSISERRI